METPRRSFLKIVFGALSAALAALLGAPITVAFLDPSRRKTVRGGGGPLKMGKVADLAIGVPRKREIVSERADAWDRSDPKPIGSVWLVRREGGKVDCFSGICPHLGCAVGFDAQKGTFACPCHESAFALEDGARLKGPSPRGLDPLPVEVKGDDVEVTYKQFVQGIPARKEA